MFQPAVVALVGLENMSSLLSTLMLGMGAGQFIASPFAGSESICNVLKSYFTTKVFEMIHLCIHTTGKYHHLSLGYLNFKQVL